MLKVTVDEPAFEGFEIADGGIPAVFLNQLPQGFVRYGAFKVKVKLNLGNPFEPGFIRFLSHGRGANWEEYLSRADRLLYILNVNKIKAIRPVPVKCKGDGIGMAFKI